MKNNSFALLIAFTILFITSARAAVTTASLGSALKMPNAVKPLTPLVGAKNVIVVDNRGYIIPDSIKLIKNAMGQFKIDRIDLVGHKVGNGGDYIRSTFMQLGKKALEYLTTTEAGQTIVRKNNLNTEDIKAALDINRIVLTDETLFDNTGSVVEAIGIPGLIILNSQAWLEHFESERNVYYLVFHELLRSAGVNDDNYVVSTDLIQIPNSFRVATRLLPLIPMLESDSIQSLFDLSAVVSNGSGCSAQKKEFYTELDLTKNSLEISLSNYVTLNDSKRTVDNKACSLAIPVKLPKGKRLVISLVDLQGVVSPKLFNKLQTVSAVKFEAFIAGTSKPSNTKIINLGTDDRSFLFRKTDVLTSGCGTTEMIRINTSNTLTSKVVGQSTAADSMVSNSSQIKKISVLMNLESCQ